MAPEGVVFELRGEPRWRSFSIAPTGEVSLLLSPPTTMPHEPADLSEQGIGLPSPVAVLRTDPTAPQTPSPTPSDNERIAPPEQERVRLAGRLGTDPRFRETRSGVLVGSFPLAIKQDDGSTRWEQVVTFRERAARLREDGPQKGQSVEVIGYRHTRLQPTKEGTMKSVEEVYAVVIKQR